MLVARAKFRPSKLGRHAHYKGVESGDLNMKFESRLMDIKNNLNGGLMD